MKLIKPAGGGIHATVGHDVTQEGSNQHTERQGRYVKRARIAVAVGAAGIATVLERPICQPPSDGTTRSLADPKN